MTITIIYKATNTINNKVYIGQTTRTLKQRVDQHIQSAFSKGKHYGYFLDAIKEYGADAFVFEEIDTAENRDELDEKEAYWISYYHATDSQYGYNSDTGGRFCKKSDRTKKLIGEHTKTLWQNEETSKRMYAGLRAGTETVKANKGCNDILFTCPVCGKQMMLNPYIVRDKKFCSGKCAAKVSSHIGLEIANELNKERKQEQRDSMKNDIIAWGINNKDKVLSCPLNEIETTYAEMIEYIRNKYQINDFRCMIYSVINSYRKKDFAKYMVDVCSKENVCRPGLN